MKESNRVIVKIITLTASLKDLTIIFIPIEIFLIIFVILIIQVHFIKFVFFSLGIALYSKL